MAEPARSAVLSDADNPQPSIAAALFAENATDSRMVVGCPCAATAEAAGGAVRVQSPP